MHHELGGRACGKLPRHVEDLRKMAPGRRCGHCRSLAPKWTKVAAALKGIAKVGAINCDDEQALCGQHGYVPTGSMHCPLLTFS